MRVNKKRVWWALAVAVVVVVAIGGAWWSAAPPPAPQIITLPDGEQYRFAGVTYGTKAAPPVFAAHLVEWLPARLAKPARKFFGAKISELSPGQVFDTPRLIVWFQTWRTNVSAPPNAWGTVVDTSILAGQSGINWGSPAVQYLHSSMTWSYLEFSNFPRRSATLQVYLYPHSFDRLPNINGAPWGVISFPNPLYGRFPQWQPEPIPTVKQAGDLEVRLDEIVTGHATGWPSLAKPNGSHGVGYSPPRPGEQINTGFDFSVRPVKGTNEWWGLENATLSDATGNVLDGRSSIEAFFVGHNVHLSQEPAPGWIGWSESLQLGTLSPDETAWRLKLELKRAFGFGPEELITFKNVALPKIGMTNTMRMSETIGGVRVLLTEFVRRPDIHGLLSAPGDPRNYFTSLCFELPDKPAGVALRLISWSLSLLLREREGNGGFLLRG